MHAESIPKVQCTHETNIPTPNPVTRCEHNDGDNVGARKTLNQLAGAGWKAGPSRCKASQYLHPPRESGAAKSPLVCNPCRPNGEPWPM